METAPAAATAINFISILAVNREISTVRPARTTVGASAHALAGAPEFRHSPSSHFVDPVRQKSTLRAPDSNTTFASVAASLPQRCRVVKEPPGRHRAQPRRPPATCPQ